jgi:hypothetical protein
MTEPTRYYSGPVDEAGAIVEVFGWYEKQEWVRIRLVKKTSLGWIVERMKEKPIFSSDHYVIQRDEKSFCPKCHKPVDLLCRTDGSIRAPWFYICWGCQFVAEVGKGEVLRAASH